MARIIPVIDVMDGRVVRAVGGRRDEYRPWVSPLCGSADPVAVALALVERTGTRDLYVADLDAIRGHPILSPNIRTIAALATSGVKPWVDYGHRDDFDETEMVGAGVAGLVLGTETISDPATLLHTAGLHRGFTPAVLSLDFQDGLLRRVGQGWQDWGCLDDPLQVVRLAVEFDLAGVLLLDLTAVGRQGGPATAPLCRRIRTAFPELELWTGGGVRDWADVRWLEDAGVDGVLVASALHDGTLTFPRPAP